MVLTIDSDDAYLVESQACIRVAGYFQLNRNRKSSLFFKWSNINRMQDALSRRLFLCRSRNGWHIFLRIDTRTVIKIGLELKEDLNNKNIWVKYPFNRDIQHRRKQGWYNQRQSTTVGRYRGGSGRGGDSGRGRISGRGIGSYTGRVQHTNSSKEK